MTWLPGWQNVGNRNKKAEILIIENDKYSGKKIKGVPEVYANNQGGLLDIQLHPDYENNGWDLFQLLKAG